MLHLYDTRVVSGDTSSRRVFSRGPRAVLPFFAYTLWTRCLGGRLFVPVDGWMPYRAKDAETHYLSLLLRGPHDVYPLIHLLGVIFT